MFQNVRLTLAWLHTWFGLVFGFVLMAVFFFGSLSVFDREIDRWARPETRIAPQPMPSFDTLLAPLLAGIEPDPEYLEEARRRVTQPLPDRLKVIEWGAYQTHRDPVLRLYARFEVPHSSEEDDSVSGVVTIDPRDGRILSDERLNIGSEFFYPMHYSLHLDWMRLGIWIVGFAAMTMLVALVSGVVMHRKIFREFFTFRPRKALQRSTLDLHNMTGVVALPFHFLWSLSGLIIFAGIYFPVGDTMLDRAAEAQDRAYWQETGLDEFPSGVPGGIGAVDAMVAAAQARWAERGAPGEVGFLTITHVGQSNAYVSVYRDSADRVATGEGLHFAAATGRLIHEDPPYSAIATVEGFLTGMHLQQFEHWTLRWLIFVAGLVSCVCIATGFVFFVEKRKHRHAKLGATGARWADTLAIATVTGMVVATLAILVANRLLPEALPGRDAWEEGAFWAAWAFALAHAAARSAAVTRARTSPAWAEQCWAIAVLAALAVGLNAATTGGHLLRTIPRGYWPVAGMDLVLLATAIVAVAIARRLQRVGSIGNAAFDARADHA